jgi:hypothetical protein
MENKTLKQTAKELFASTEYKELFGVASRESELFTSENLAKLACGKDEKPIRFRREDFEEKEAKTEELEFPFNAKTTIAKIKEATSLEALAEFETEAENRTTVLSAIEAQKEKLNAQKASEENQESTKTE